MGWLPKANWETALDYFRQIVRGCSRMVLARGGLSCPVPCECAPWEALQCRLKPLHFDGFQVLSCQVDPGWPRRLSSSGTSRWTSRSWKVTPSTAGARRRWRRAAGSRSTRTASSSRGKARGERPRCWTCHRWPGQDIFKVGVRACTCLCDFKFSIGGLLAHVNITTHIPVGYLFNTTQRWEIPNS